MMHIELSIAVTRYEECSNLIIANPVEMWYYIKVWKKKTEKMETRAYVF